MILLRNRRAWAMDPKAVWLCVALALSLPIQTLPQTPSGVMLIEAAHLLDPRTRNVLAPAAVLIEGDRIKKVGMPSQISTPTGYRNDIMGFREAKNISYFAASGRARAPAPATQFRDCPNGCPEMVMLPRGRFVMGAPPGEEERENAPDYFRGHSVPRHSVTIEHSFAIAKFDVTRDEYAQFVAETKRPDPDSCYTPDASGGESDKKDAK